MGLYSMTIINLESILAIISHVAIIVGVVIAVMQLRKMRISNDQQKQAFIADHERRKKQATIEFVHQVLEERIKATDIINTIFVQNDVINVNDQKYLNNKNIDLAVTRYLNLMERIAVGINIGVYDITVFMRITGMATINFYKRIEPIIKEKRRATGRSSMYSEFSALVYEMEILYNQADPPIKDTSANIIHS